MEYILTVAKGWDDDPSYFTVTLREEGNGSEEIDFFRNKSEEDVVKFINKVTEEYGFEYHNLYPNDYMMQHLSELNQYSEWNIYSR
tara:strand:- start:58 stop:315 length:258 start_codon:yes stop_codon:yes gene_type:complete